MGFQTGTGAEAAVLALRGDEPARDLPVGALAQPRHAPRNRLGGSPVTTQTLRADASSAPTVSAVRDILFVMTLVLAWVTVNPFPSLSDPKLITIGDTSDRLNQFAYVALAGAVAIHFLMHDTW